MGNTLRSFARGEDISEVKPYDFKSADVEREVKSYGNGLTAPADIEDAATTKAYIWMLSESVAQRMRKGKARARTISIGVRYASDLTGYTRQAPALTPTNITTEIASIAWELLRSNEPLDETAPLRALHVRASNLVPTDKDMQLSLFDPLPKRTELETLDSVIDTARYRWGNKIIVWGPQTIDNAARTLDAKAGNTIHPVSFFHR